MHMVSARVDKNLYDYDWLFSLLGQDDHCYYYYCYYYILNINIIVPFLWLASFVVCLRVYLLTRIFYRTIRLL